MRRLLYIFIPILAIFLMSHNASALDLNIDLNDYEKISPSISGRYDYQFSNSSNNCIAAYNCDFKSGNYLRVASTHDSFQIKKGDIVTYQLYLYQTSSTVTISNLIAYQLTPGVPASTIYFRDMTNQSYFIPAPTSGLGVMHVSKAYDIALIYSADGTYKLGSYNPNTNDMYMETVASDPNNETKLKIAVVGFTIYRKKESSSINQEQEEATQEAVDDSADAGDSSSSDAENASSSLISAIGGFVNAVTSASPSNCNIDGNMGNMDLGTVNLCANPVPTFVQIISSLVLIAICIPFAIIMFNRFIGMFRSFQG